VRGAGASGTAASACQRDDCLGLMPKFDNCDVVSPFLGRPGFNSISASISPNRRSARSTKETRRPAVGIWPAVALSPYRSSADGMIYWNRSSAEVPLQAQARRGNHRHLVRPIIRPASAEAVGSLSS